MPWLASLALVLGTWSAVGNCQQPVPISIAFNDSMPVGPDGPWLSITQAVDVQPVEYLSFLPSFSKTTLIINASACNAVHAKCPLPRPVLWEASHADDTDNDDWTVGVSQPASAWDAKQAALLGLNGNGSAFLQALTLHPDGDFAVPDFLYSVVVTASNGYAATYPNGTSYTLDVGFFSLYADADPYVWTNSTGFEYERKSRILLAAYNNKFIPSVSFGMHVGSVYPPIDGSLVLGGYDAARILSEPLVSNTNNFSLQSITLNVSSGASAYRTSNGNSIPGTNLLRANGSASGPFQVNLDPGVPYLYLPQATCSAIAAHLPVTLNNDLNLYIWNSGPVFQNIVTSPHFMSFTLASDDGSSTTTINVPFALLNLTLTSPVVSEDVQYFPCSPWVPNGAPYTLGRAFLQAAFLGANWQTNTFFLSQAPGPDVRVVPAVTTINKGDTAINAATNPPSWASTWNSTLVNLQPDTTSTSDTGLSGGAIAGIVIGVIALIAILAGLVALFLFRKRKQRRLASQQHSGEQEELRPYGSPQGFYAPTQYHDNKPGPVYEKKPGLVEAPNNARTLVEVPAHHLVEMNAHPSEPQELGPGK